MKCYIKQQKLIPASKIDDYVNECWDKKYDEMFSHCKQDIIAQVLSVCLNTLANRFGFGKKRLLDFLSDVEGTFTIMDGQGIFGKRFTTVDLIKQINQDYGINLDKDNMFKKEENKNDL